tara:strand:+ start:195 stop:464 length:270 start_codon:yes stop_codon:yes gene_type:complete
MNKRSPYSVVGIRGTKKEDLYDDGVTLSEAIHWVKIYIRDGFAGYNALAIYAPTGELERWYDAPIDEASEIDDDDLIATDEWFDRNRQH